MKFVKVLSLILAILMLGISMVACGNGAETKAETEAGTEVETNKEPLNVNIVIRGSETGEDKYVSGDRGYDFEGDVLTVQEIVIEFMSFEYDVEVEVDDNGKMGSVGELVKGDGQFWLFSVAKAPKGAEQAEPINANIDEYSEIEAGDTIVVYLS